MPTTIRSSRNDFASFRAEMLPHGVRLDSAARNAVWKRLEPALKMNNPKTHRLLRADEVPSREALAKMKYYPLLTSTDLVRGSGGYEGFYDGTDLYVLQESGGLGSKKVQRWHILPDFQMPGPSRPAFS